MAIVYELGFYRLLGKAIKRFFTLLILCGVVLTAYPAFSSEALQTQNYHPWECPVALNGAECGYLLVPLDRANPDGPTIKLSVAIFKATGDNPAPDPVVYLNGGPGVSSLDYVGLYIQTLLSDFLNGRDIIIMEQRGTGFSFPRLDCQ
jgi:hypothetical protein